MALLTLRITGRDLPGRDCGDFLDVHVGTQRGTEPDQLVPADAEEAVFDLTADVVAAPDGTTGFRGPWVQGPRGARFVYLTSGEPPARAAPSRCSGGPSSSSATSRPNRWPEGVPTPRSG